MLKTLDLWLADVFDMDKSKTFVKFYVYMYICVSNLKALADKFDLV